MNIIEQIAFCVERGKVDQNAPFPPDLKGQEGTDELTKKAIYQGIEPDKILKEGLIKGMFETGVLFKANKIFVPQVLMSAKAMSAAMEHLRPFFNSGEIKKKGTMVIGTVAGDLHDIGKNLVSMIVEGAGWEIVDLGINVTSEKFIKAVDENPGCVVGLSALLTTTMVSMGKIIEEIKEKHPGTKVLVGGAPVNQEFANQINADLYSSDPQGAVDFLNQIVD
jgi:5-methyltetrahydrofolate--homocysteine methyltransferase